MAKFKTSESKNRPPLYWRKKYAFLFCILGIVLSCGFLYARHQAEQVTPAQKQENLNNALITAVRQDKRNEVVELLHLGANPNGHRIIYQLMPSTANQVKNPLLRRFAAFLERRSYHRCDCITTALHVALSNIKDRDPVPSNPAIVALLIEAGADVNAVDDGEGVPLSYAARTSQSDVAELLLDHGARINYVSPRGTALDMAVCQDDVSTVTLLIHRGADVNLADDYGWTPLMGAARNGHEKIVNILLNAGASVSPRNSLGWDALKCASDNHHAAIAQLLKKHGALPARSVLQRAKK